MDFDSAARCIHELRCNGTRAAGAAHELECEVDSSRVFSTDIKRTLEALINSLFPKFGIIDAAVLDEIENILLQYDDFVRSYMARRLQNAPLNQ